MVQIRGGRKGGLAGCDAAIWSGSTGPMVVAAGGAARTTASCPTKLKQLMAQAAIEVQSSAALLPGLAWPGQPSSICWVADISIACAACILKAAPAAAGSRATDTAIRIANMVRPTAIALLSHAKYPAP